MWRKLLKKANGAVDFVCYKTGYFLGYSIAVADNYFPQMGIVEGTIREMQRGEAAAEAKRRETELRKAEAEKAGTIAVAVNTEAIERAKMLQEQLNQKTSEIARLEALKGDHTYKIADLRSQVTSLSTDIDVALSLAHKSETERLASLELVSRTTATIEELTEVLRQHERTIQEQQLAMHELVRKNREQLQERYRTTLRNLTFSEKAMKWLARQTDARIVNNAEAALHNLNEGRFEHNNRGKMAGSGYVHCGFGESHRIYYLRKETVYVALIGDKRSQASDEQWLREHDAP